ncbi:hypothetical protein [Deinococcus rufus]|uniref:DUF721 domain-containing protein n=1 Tax=Deinococcus rufus TaxID=2136097 RepID=A0ABV7ZBL4_9DEIO
MSDAGSPDLLPPVRIVPQQLSAEHHLLRRLSDQQPSTLGQVLRAVLRTWPEYTSLGVNPDLPTPRARNAWARIAAEPWTRPAPPGMGSGLLLTGHGEVRLENLYRQQVVMPWARAVEAQFGRDVARRALAEFR